MPLQTSQERGLYSPQGKQENNHSQLIINVIAKAPDTVFKINTVHNENV